MEDPTVIRGTLNLHSETGTEGGWWAIQDERFIQPRTEDWPHERWSYDGLHLLKDGDHLKILAPDGSIYWEGFINLKQYGVFTEEAFGFWIHADQSGIDREFWAMPFFKEYKGELVKGIRVE
jgi:hypothetical protein